MPVVGPTVATAGVPLDQVPPGMASLSVVVVPTQMPSTPVIGAAAFTVIVLIVEQPPTE
jgi:hypothetical protein